MELRKYRKAKGFTQKQLADIVGVKPHTISNYETGEREPPLALLKMFAKVLDCSVDDLLSDI